MLAHNLSDLILDTVKELPHEKQQEVFDFAVFLREQNGNLKKGTASFEDLVGVLEGPADLSAKHDEIYD
jgi:hypothetical protein